jgi:thiosulfate/3-mercaptopyruvate sulfurtransferase
MTNQSTLPLLLEPEQLLPHLGAKDLLILDVSSAENYAKHHIPGAIHIAPSSLQCGEPPTPGKLPSAERLTQLFSRVGLSSDQHVIAYDDEGGGWAGRLIWTLDVLGHRNYTYLNGGLPAWVNEGHPTETAAPTPLVSNFKASIDSDPIASLAQVLASLSDADTAIWDARSKQEYEGSKIVAKRGGHIPGAVNIDWLELMDRDRNLRLIDLEQLQSRLDQLGLSKDKCVITHCQTHHRSGLTYLAMKILGYPNIKGYDGSWSEWGNRDDTPIET